MIPLHDKPNSAASATESERILHYHASPLRTLEHILHPWVAFGVLPLFAFANAGVALGGASLGVLFAPLPLAIALGLFVGKQAGIFGLSALLIKTGWAKLPHNASWLEFYGVALLAGIGFTMSLFIGSLAFKASYVEHMEQVRLGVLMGSTLSGVVGFLLLRHALAKRGDAG
jgi:NhaA family Na+:H+ antiporter